jgi:ankyrin repeat protein/DNA-directed RNA polymerase specialized sigma24 family protein
MDDGPILQQFLDSAAQEPFAHLVARHVHLVYSACLRQLKDPTLADQATQATFVLLARNAARLTRQSSLVPFLFTTAYQVCQRVTPSPDTPGEGRGEGPSAIYSAPTDWASIASKIDDAIASLPDGVRDAFLLKYLANLSLRDVANALKTEDARAGQRISAAVTALRRQLESQNLFLPPEALVAAVQAHAIRPAPASAAYNAALAAFSTGAPIPANQMADAVSAAQRRDRIISIAMVLSLVLLLGVGALKLRTTIKNARLAAATQATTQPDASAPDSDPPFVRPRPQLPPMPEKKIPAPRPDKPVDPALAARFIAAIRQSDVDSVQQLFDRDENVVNVKDPRTGRSAVEIAADLVAWHRQDATRIAHFLIDNGAAATIHTAARAGHKDMVAQFLNDHPNQISVRDKEGLTPLQRAALLNNSSPECEEVADLLIQAGANVDLWTACTLGRFDDVKQALADHPDQADQPCLGATPLNWAVRPRRYADDPLAIPKLLIDKGANLKSRDTANDGMTPLHHAAAWGGQAAVAGLLIEKGVDVNMLDDFGWTPLDYAIDRGKKDMIEFLQSKGGRRTTIEYATDRPAKTARFYAAVQSGDVDLTHRLLDDTPELATARGPTGETPLHHAAAIGANEIIDLLLADRADLNAQETNKYGGTPLHWAVRHNQPDAVKHLLEKGADPKLTNTRTDQTLLHVAAQHTDNPALIDLLLKTGIDRAAKDRFGKTALDYAQQAGHSKVTAKLK